MLSLVRANAAGVEYRLSGRNFFCELFSIVAPDAPRDQQRHHAVPPHPRPGIGRGFVR